MKFLFSAVVLMAQWQIGLPSAPVVRPDDPRPPYVSIHMTSDELKRLNDAEAEVINRQAELDLAQRNLEKLQGDVIRSHRMENMPEFTMCGEVGYHAHIDRSYVVWELGVTQCRGL